MSTAKVNVESGGAATDNIISNRISSCSNNENSIILSLFLIQTEDDILYPRGCSSTDKKLKTNCNLNRRAILYKRLCDACLIANKILRDASSKTQPFQTGGDGPVFGVHCNISNDDILLKSRFGFDADEYWQSQYPKNQSATNDDNDIRDEQSNNDVEQRSLETDNTFQQPHLRAIFRYGNDVNDMWRVISLVLKISTELASVNLRSAIECWDVNDGHILLIESAEHLPSWVDDDVLQDGVGGPGGMLNRCWIVDGQVHLIPPITSRHHDTSLLQKKEKVDLLSRRDALFVFMDSFKNDSDGSSTLASESVQNAVHHRINRTDYSAKINCDKESLANESSTPHWHVAAAALPAAVAYFVQKHTSLIPLIVDSFCEHAPKYLKDRASARKHSRSKSRDRHEDIATTDKNTTQQEMNNERHVLGNLFPFEHIVTVPITMTRANFAELVTGRGIVPSFPVPKEYCTVELKKYHRQLLTALGWQYSNNKELNRNPFERAVEVGVRLCAGLEWIVVLPDQNVTPPISDDLPLQSLGVVERRLRLYWTRIDAETSREYLLNDDENNDTSDWIENAWQTGPMNINHLERNKFFLDALESMSKCPVFHPELSKSLRDEPCPISKPRKSLRDITQSGIKNALKWQREHHDESYFPTPKLCQLGNESWMEINSIEEMEEEMKHLSSVTIPAKPDSNGSRRTTRRSQRKHPSLDKNESNERLHEASSADTDTLHKMAKGFRSFVEGHGDVEGIGMTSCSGDVSSIDSIENLFSQEVNIRPQVFLGVLRSMLRNQCSPSSPSGADVTRTDSPSTPAEPDISSFFFEEDLDYESSNDSDTELEKQHLDLLQDCQINPDDDPFSLKNIMVSREWKDDNVSLVCESLSDTAYFHSL